MSVVLLSLPIIKWHLTLWFKVGGSDDEIYRYEKHNRSVKIVSSMRRQTRMGVHRGRIRATQTREGKRPGSFCSKFLVCLYDIS